MKTVPKEAIWQEQEEVGSKPIHWLKSSRASHREGLTCTGDEDTHCWVFAMWNGILMENTRYHTCFSSTRAAPGQLSSWNLLNWCDWGSESPAAASTFSKWLPQPDGWLPLPRGANERFQSPPSLPWQSVTELNTTCPFLIPPVTNQGTQPRGHVPSAQRGWGSLRSSSTKYFYKYTYTRFSFLQETVRKTVWVCILSIKKYQSKQLNECIVSVTCCCRGKTQPHPLPKRKE